MQLTLPALLSSVPTARHWVRSSYGLLVREGCCGPAIEQSVLDLLTTEAVANAVLHGSGEVLVDLSCADGVVRVAVSDDSRALPVVRRDGPEVVGGHGMALIETLSSRWGVDVLSGDGTGKTIWFELVA